MIAKPSLRAEQATQHLSLRLKEGEDSLKRKEDKKTKQNKKPIHAFDQAALGDKRRPLVSLPEEREALITGWEAGCWVQAANFAASTGA